MVTGQGDAAEAGSPCLIKKEGKYVKGNSKDFITGTVESTL